jgi:glucokinase
MIIAGADLGGTHLRVGLRRAGETRLLARRSLSADPTWTPAQVVEAVAAMLEALQPTGEPLAALGFGATGDIDPEGGACWSMRRFPGLEGAPLAALLTARLGVPVQLLNDGLCAALGELRAGAGQGARDFVMVTLGTGIGGGVVLDGRLVTAARGRVGKAGHMIVDWDGPVQPTCHCGLPGCWQALAARAGLLHRARELAAAHPESLLAAGSAGVDPTPEHIAEWAAAGDPAALAVWRETGRLVGVGLANLVKLFAPERVLIGGGLAAGHPELLRAARAEIERHAIKPYQRPDVLLAALGPDAGLLGATWAPEELASHHE